METYSNICTQARTLFVDASKQSMKNAAEMISFWSDMVQIGQKFTMGSSIHDLRFDRADFNDDTWKMVTVLMKPFESLGCAEKRKDANRITAFILKPSKFNETALRDLVDRRKKPRAKVEPVATPEQRAPEQVVKIVARRPERNKYAPSIAIIVDLANMTKHLHGGEGGRRILDPNRINWRVFRNNLARYKEKSLPIERAVICVSEDYYTKNYKALMLAQEFFTIEKMGGEKDADPVVTAQILRVVLDHLNIQYSDRLPVIALASGDKDFSYIIEALRPYIIHEGLSLQLRIAAWREGLSRELDYGAGEILLIDDIFRFIDPFGEQLRNSMSKKLRRA